MQVPVKEARRRLLNVEEYIEGIRSGSRSILGRAITMIESHNPEHHCIAEDIITRLLPYSGLAYRVGITGVPGVGKSTFIEALGVMLTTSGHKVAVLTVDPSSIRTGGSILGDKTRMERLSVDTNAFIRPSPSSGTLGGVTHRTRETMLLCEAAGYNVILVETVGVGQSEVIVAGMVDFFLVLMLPGAGDELQGIKKGILEIADMIAINKADGYNEIRADLAASEYRNALRIIASPTSTVWKTPVVVCAGLSGKGVDSLWGIVLEHHRLLSDNGELLEKRRQQKIYWMRSMLDDRLMQMLHRHPIVREMLPTIEQDVAGSRLSPAIAVERILGAFLIQDGMRKSEESSSESSGVGMVSLYE